MCSSHLPSLAHSTPAEVFWRRQNPTCRRLERLQHQSIGEFGREPNSTLSTVITIGSSTADLAVGRVNGHGCRLLMQMQLLAIPMSTKYVKKCAPQNRRPSQSTSLRHEKIERAPYVLGHVERNSLFVTPTLNRAPVPHTLTAAIVVLFHISDIDGVG